ncbi:MAG: GNAT family N-acetyltransferase [Mycobacteriales bacterium]
MNIHPVEDLGTLRAFHAVEAATADHDYVALPADPIDELVPLLDGRPRAGDLTLLRLGTDGGTPVGTLTLSLPLLDNLGAANLEVHVHPAHRRRGHGRALLEAALAEVTAQGRTRVFGQAPWGPDETDGPAFGLLRSLGFRQVLDDYRRLLDLTASPLGAPLDPPQGYRVVQWLDRAPDGLVDGAAYLLGRMTLDAPMGEMDYEQEKWDAARLRAKEQDCIERNRLRVATCVVHEATGAVAGLTEIGVNRARTTVAYQWDTIVDPDHRGQRLGLVLKSWNHRHLVDQVPEVAYVNTWNAASNTYMIAVNEALGFRPAERWSEWQLDL